MSHRVLYGEGAQTLRFIPIGPDGRPNRVTSATYRIDDMRWSTDGAERVVVAAGTAAVLSAASATLSSAGGANASNPQRLHVDNVTSFVDGRRYLLSTADGSSREVIQCSGIDAGATRYIFSLHDIQGIYPVGSTLQAIELEATFPALEANDETEVEEGGGPYQVLWDFSVAGRAYLVPQEIWLVRYSVQPWIDETDVLMAYPVLAQRVRNRATVQKAISTATADVVAQLEGARLNPEEWRLSTQGKVAVRDRSIQYLLMWQQTGDDDLRAERWNQSYLATMQNILVGHPGRVVRIDGRSDEQSTDIEIDAYFKRP